MSGSHTVVVGAGVVGVCTAYYLARRGHEVTLLDKGDIGSGASFGNAGIIAPGHPPLPRPGLIKQAIKWMFDSASPLYIPPRLDRRLLSWLWEFRRACTHVHEIHCMKILARLGRESLACFDQLVSEEGIGCEYQRRGWMEVFRTTAGLETGRRDAELVRRFGFEAEVLSPEALRDCEPALRPGAAGAVRYVDSATADPHRFVVELADRARGHGAVVRPHTDVGEILFRNGRVAGVRIGGGERIAADTLVLAAGTWTTRLAETIGLHIPMQPGKGYHLNLVAPDPCPRSACVLGEVYVAATPMGGGLRLAGTMEFSGLNHRLHRRRLEMLVAGARKYLAGIDEARPVSTWCGLRPCTADGLPVVGWARDVPGVLVATGHARMGFTLGPVTGKLISECIVDGEPSIDLDPLRVERFVRAGGDVRRRRHLGVVPSAP